MKKYVLFVLACMMPVFLGAWRRELIKKEPFNKHQEQIIKEIEVSHVVESLTVDEQENGGGEIRADEFVESAIEPLPIQELVPVSEAPIVLPPSPPRPRLLYVGIAERDKKELVALAKNLGFQYVSSLVFDADSFASYAVVVVSDMSKLRQIAPYADLCKKLLLWIRRRCTDDEYACIRELATCENVRMVVCSPGERAFMRKKGIPVDRVVLILPSLPYPLRRALLKKILFPRPPKPVVVPEKVQEQEIKEDDVPKASDTSLGDQLSVEEHAGAEVRVDGQAAPKIEPSQKEEQVLVEEAPALPQLPRLLHVATGERDKKELAQIVQDFDFECSSCLALKGELSSPCDVVVVSNMSQLGQIAQQADSYKQIVLWVRGRCADDEYEAMRELVTRENVRTVVSTPYEKEYMKGRDIDVDRAVVVWPQYAASSMFGDRNMLFLPAGLQESHLKRVMVACAAQGIHVRDDIHRGAAYCAASESTLCFPGIMPDHLLLEHLQQGIVQFVPTIRFLKRLGFVSRARMNMIHTSEWYNSEYADFIQYFNSWADLKTKMLETDYAALAKKIEQLGLKEGEGVAVSWRELLDDDFIR